MTWHYYFVLPTFFPERLAAVMLPYKQKLFILMKLNDVHYGLKTKTKKEKDEQMD